MQGLLGLVCLWAWVVWHEQYEFCSEWGSICLLFCSLSFKWEGRFSAIWFQEPCTWEWELFGWCGKMVIFQLPWFSNVLTLIKTFCIWIVCIFCSHMNLMSRLCWLFLKLVKHLQNGQYHPVWGQMDNYAVGREKRKQLLLMLCQHEADRLEVWAQPLSKYFHFSAEYICLYFGLTIFLGSFCCINVFMIILIFCCLYLSLYLGKAYLLGPKSAQTNGLNMPGLLSQWILELLFPWPQGFQQTLFWRLK